MLNSFKERLVKTIEQLQDAKSEIVQALQGLSYEQLATELLNYSEPKAVKTLLSVLESDFDVQQDNIEALFEKIEQVKQELNKQPAESERIPPQQINTVHIQSPAKRHDTELEDQDNQFLKDQLPDPKQVSPTVEITRTPVRPSVHLPRKAKITRQLLHKQKLKTDADIRGNSFIQQKAVTEASQQAQYYSQQKVPEWRQVEGAEHHWQKVFQHYHKLPLGILKQNSFEERSQSYKTMNYEKILAFLTDVSMNLTADGRLSMIKIMRKHALNHKFITKSEFKDIYEELQSTFDIKQEKVHELLYEKDAALQSNAREFRRKITSVERTLQSMTKKEPSRARNRKAIVFPHQREKIERTYTSQAADKLKIKELTWQVLFNLSDASLFMNAPMPPIDLNRANQDEDSYYLQQYYSKKEKQPSPLKDPTKQLKTKTVLPAIRPRMTPLRPH